MAQAWTNTAVDMDGDADNQVVDRRTVLHRIWYHNDDAAVRYLHIYDAAHGDVDPSMDAGDIVFPIAADTIGNIELGLSMDNGLTVCASTTAAAGGSAATAFSVVVVYG